MGFMVNRPMKLTVAELLDQLGIAAGVASKQPVLEGGPVKTERGFILHSDDVQYEASLPLGNGLMLSTARQTLEAIGTGRGPETLRRRARLRRMGQRPTRKRTAAERVADLPRGHRHPVRRAVRPTGQPGRGVARHRLQADVDPRRSRVTQAAPAVPSSHSISACATSASQSVRRLPERPARSQRCARAMACRTGMRWMRYFAMAARCAARWVAAQHGRHRQRDGGARKTLREKLRSRYRLTVEIVDERLTSFEARGTLGRYQRPARNRRTTDRRDLSGLVAPRLTAASVSADS